MTKALIYVRVSKTSMDYERQISDLKAQAELQKLDVIEIVTEKISGSAKVDQREGLKRVLKLAEEGAYQKLLISEVSRLGRTHEVHTTINFLSQHGISVFIANYSMESLDKEGKPNSMIGLMMTMLAEFSRIEKETLIQRIKSGIAQARKEGKILGRRKGSLKSREQYTSEYKPIIRLLEKHLSLREISRLQGCSINTVRKVKLMFAA